jgi:peptidyl-prolyl cis-trans isomerase SurA
MTSERPRVRTASRSTWLASLLVACLALTALPGVQARELDRILAVVNDDVIVQSELEAAMQVVREQLRQQRAQLPPEQVLQRQVLERVILTRLQLQLATSTGIRVDDETLNRAVQEIAAQNRLSLSEFRDILEADGFSFARFREDIRNEIVINRLQQRQVTNRITVTDQEVENFLANQSAQGTEHTRYRLAHILIATPEAASPEQVQAARAKAEQVLAELRAGSDFHQTAVSVSDGQQALAGGDLGWREAGQLPSLFADVAVQLAPGEVSDLIRNASGFHIVKLVDRQGEEHVVTQTHARHILIRPDELTTHTDARNRLEQLRERVLAGEEFANLARSHSADPGSAASGGSLGWVNPGDLVPQFEEVMDRLGPGQVSEPFETPFGWHVVQVLERRQHDNTEDVRRARARELIRQRKAEEELEVWLRRLRDEAYVEIRDPALSGQG